jgi:phospholipid/cholesterol/gamma-HCH transport system substrate-binding protein
MMRIVRKNLAPFLAIIGLAVVAGAVALYILDQQQMRFPWEAKPLRIYAEMPTAQAVTPGQGQSVQVSGVRIGAISKVKLKEGRALLTLDIDPGNEGLVRRDAKAMLRPRTALKDMYVQIFPGSRDAPAAKKGFTIPVRDTRTDVNLEELLSELDARTRDYLVLLASGTGRGLKDQGDELAEIFDRFGPTMRDLATVSRAVGQEHRALRRLVTSVADLNTTLARNPDALSEMVDASAATFSAFASEDARLRESLGELPPTLRRATRTLQAVRPFARELRPATRSLVPAVRALDRANRQLRPFARKAEPVVRREIRPFARTARPLVRDLVPAANGLSQTLPELTRSTKVANRFFNMLGSNPNGREGPEATDREEGFLFWLGWLFHQTTNLQNVEDANGPIRPIFVTGTCDSLTTLSEDNPAAEAGFGLSPLLATVCGNPNTLQPALDALQELLP